MAAASVAMSEARRDSHSDSSQTSWLASSIYERACKYHHFRGQRCVLQALLDGQLQVQLSCPACARYSCDVLDGIRVHDVLRAWCP